MQNTLSLLLESHFSELVQDFSATKQNFTAQTGEQPYFSFIGCVLQKCCDFVETGLLPLVICHCLHDFFSSAPLKISQLIKLTLFFFFVPFELISHIQLLWYRWKDFQRSTFLESFFKSTLVPSLKEGLWFMLQPVSCVCLANWLDCKNWRENRLFALHSLSEVWGQRKLAHR